MVLDWRAQRYRGGSGWWTPKGFVRVVAGFVGIPIVRFYDIILSNEQVRTPGLADEQVSTPGLADETVTL